MQNKKQFCNLISRTMSRAATVALATATVFALTVVLADPLQAQTYQVIHHFTRGPDGASPMSGFTMDAAGNLYGTTSVDYPGGYCDAGNGGTVFKMTKRGSGWVFTTLYNFAGGDDGACPYGRVAIAQDGTLYGTTEFGGGACPANGCGTVFHLSPPPGPPRTALARWSETVLYRFTGGSDGWNPQGDLALDASGNIYGTTITGGTGDCWGGWGCGTVYELTPSGAGWTETVLSFTENNPYGGVIFDKSGNLYGTASDGGSNPRGSVYELSVSGSGWIGQTLYSFTGGSDGYFPYGGLIWDSSGNLYGTTSVDIGSGGGTVFELTPGKDGWTFDTLYRFQGGYGEDGPHDKLVMDASGNLYGTTFADGAYGYGSVFKLTRSNGGWTYTSLHDFNGTDGAYPVCNLIFDADGNLYGTASGGGGFQGGPGVVFEITP